MTVSPAKIQLASRRDRFNLIVAFALLGIISVLMLRPGSADQTSTSPDADTAAVVAAVTVTPTAEATPIASPESAETPSPTASLTPSPTATPLPPLILDRPRLARDGRISLAGLGTVAAIVEVWDGEERIASVVVDETGGWEWEGVLAPGTHQIQARMLTADRAALDESEWFELAVAEPAPPFNLPFLNEPVFIPETGDVVLTGTGNPGDSLAIVQDGRIVDAVQVAEDSIWQYGVTLPIGDYEFAIWTLNAEGEPAVKSPPIAVRVTAMPTPTATHTPAPRTPYPLPDPGPGRVYIVQPGDSLAKIAIAQYNNYNLYTQIITATNAKAAQDGSFAPIIDPAKLRTGQKLWLPALP